MTRLAVLYEQPRLPEFALPAELRDAYGGTFGFERPRLVANFVSTVDGIVAVPELPQSNKLISAGNDADRFVMGLLRAAADVVVVGAGTLRASARGLWTPERAFPPAADAFASFRKARSLPEHPEVAVLTGTGDVPLSHPLFERGAVVLTTAAGASRLAGRLPAASSVVTLGEGRRAELRSVVEALRARGHSLLLSEAGPETFGGLIAAGLVDELFLTISPLFGGRTTKRDTLGLIEGVSFLPDTVDAHLLGVRRDEHHLFLRYELVRP